MSPVQLTLPLKAADDYADLGPERRDLTTALALRGPSLPVHQAAR